MVKSHLFVYYKSLTTPSARISCAILSAILSKPFFMASAEMPLPFQGTRIVHLSVTCYLSNKSFFFPINDPLRKWLAQTQELESHASHEFDSVLCPPWLILHSEGTSLNSFLRMTSHDSLPYCTDPCAHLQSPLTIRKSFRDSQIIRIFYRHRRMHPVVRCCIFRYLAANTRSLLNSRDHMRENSARLG
jgi:hypothetical protein